MRLSLFQVLCRARKPLVSIVSATENNIDFTYRNFKEIPLAQTIKDQLRIYQAIRESDA